MELSLVLSQVLSPVNERGQHLFKCTNWVNNMVKDKVEGFDSSVVWEPQPTFACIWGLTLFHDSKHEWAGYLPAAVLQCSAVTLNVYFTSHFFSANRSPVTGGFSYSLVVKHAETELHFWFSTRYWDNKIGTGLLFPKLSVLGIQKSCARSTCEGQNRRKDKKGTLQLHVKMKYLLFNLPVF